MDQANALRDRIKFKTQSIFEQNAFANKSKFARVITITSGKGGVGKTNVALNLAINLRDMGKKVVLLDADFGLANIEVLFGGNSPYNLPDVFCGKKTIEEVIFDGPYGIKLLSGGSGIKEFTDITESQMFYLIKNFSYLDNHFDYIIIDTGAGLSKSVLNFVKAADEIVIVTTPEPTSITDAYGLLKAVTEDGDTNSVFKLIANKTENTEEGNEVFSKLKTVCEKFLNTHIEYLGCIPEDKYLVKAVKRQEPVSILYPNCGFSKSMFKISMTLMNIETENKSLGILSYMKKLINIFNN